MTKDIDHIPTEEEVQREISEYNNRRSGPVLDDASKAKGLERFFTEVLHGKSWESHHQAENIKPIGLDSENSTIEN
jgi:hypothetical protein